MCLNVFLFSEAEYAFHLRKQIIPLKMERNFEAREWLGLIIGPKLFFEFTDKYPFEEKLSGLLKEVLKDHQKHTPQKPAISNTVPDYTEARLIKLIVERILTSIRLKYLFLKGIARHVLKYTFFSYSLCYVFFNLISYIGAFNSS